MLKGIVYIYMYKNENTGATRWSTKQAGFVAIGDICYGNELDMNNNG